MKSVKRTILLLNTYSLGMAYIYMGQARNLEIERGVVVGGQVGGDVVYAGTRRKKVIYCCNAQKRKSRERSS
jgi:hypothetical protein